MSRKVDQRRSPQEPTGHDVELRGTFTLLLMMLTAFTLMWGYVYFTMLSQAR